MSKERPGAPLHVDVFVERSMRRWLQDVADGRHSGESAVCLQLYNVQFVERLVSENGDRVICHFLAPDAESVRTAMRGAGIAADAIWVAAVEGGDTGTARPPGMVCLAANRAAGPGLADIRNHWRPACSRRYAARDGSRAIEIHEWLPRARNVAAPGAARP